MVLENLTDKFKKIQASLVTPTLNPLKPNGVKNLINVAKYASDFVKAKPELKTINRINPQPVKTTEPKIDRFAIGATANFAKKGKQVELQKNEQLYSPEKAKEASFKEWQKLSLSERLDRQANNLADFADSKKEERKSLLEDSRQMQDWIRKDIKKDLRKERLVNYEDFTALNKIPYQELRTQFPDIIEKAEKKYRNTKYIAEKVGLITRGFDEDLLQRIGENNIAQMEKAVASNPLNYIGDFATETTLGVIDFNKIANIGQDVYEKNGKIYYKGFEVDDEYLTQAGKKADAGSEMVAKLLGGFVGYGGVSAGVKGAVNLASKASNKTVAKVFGTIDRASKSKKFTTRALNEVLAVNLLEETADAAIRKSTGQEYTLANFVNGLKWGALFGGTLQVGNKKVKAQDVRTFLREANNKVAETKQLDPIMEMKIGKHNVSSLFGETRLAYLKGMQDPKARPGIDTPAPLPVSKELEPLYNEARKYKSAEEFVKAQQFKKISKENPMTDSYHVGIRDASEIKAFKETLSDSESFVYPDFTKEMAKKALKNGEITIYSSKPLDASISQFVTPSKMMASDYAGAGKVYSKKVNINDVAWINGDEGNFVGQSQLVDIWNKANQKLPNTKLPEDNRAYLRGLEGDPNLREGIEKPGKSKQENDEAQMMALSRAIEKGMVDLEINTEKLSGFSDKDLQNLRAVRRLISSNAAGDVETIRKLNPSLVNKSLELVGEVKNLDNDEAFEFIKNLPKTSDIKAIKSSIRKANQEYKQIAKPYDEQAKSAYKEAKAKEKAEQIAKDKKIKTDEKFLKKIETAIQKEVASQLKSVEDVNKARASTEKIIAKMKKKNVPDDVIKEIKLSNGIKLVDTVKIKREANGELSAVITKSQLDRIKSKYKKNNNPSKWVTKSALKTIAEAPRDLASLYEIPQVFFESKGLKKDIYDPIRNAERAAQDDTTKALNKFKKAGLLSEGGWFTADSFNLNDKQANKIGKYMLARQGKGYDVKFSDLDEVSQKFVKIVDSIIKESEEQFFRIAKKNGLEPRKVYNYAPITTKEDLELIDQGGDLEFITRKHPAFFSTKERTKNVPKELYETDYRKVVARWIPAQSRFNNLGNVGVEVKYLIDSDEFKDIVTKDDAALIHNWFKTIMSPDMPKTKGERKIVQGSRLARSTTALSSLGLNPVSVLKQALTQVPLIVIEKAPPKLQSKFAKAFNINVKDLPSIRERKGDVAIMDLQDSISRVFTGALTKFDQINAQLSLNSLLDKEYSKYLKRGKAIDENQVNLILKTAQDRLDLWYGGMSKSQLPPAFRSEIGRSLNMFILPLTSQLNGFFQHVKIGKRNKTLPKNIAEVLTSAVVIAYAEQAITNLSPQWSDSKQMAKDVIKSLVGNLPIVSQIVNVLATDSQLQLTAGISNISTLLTKIREYSKGEEDLERVAFAAAETAGLPKQIRRIREGIEIISDQGVTDDDGEMLAPVNTASEYMRALLRGKYGSLAAKDWIRNVGTKSENRTWFVPQVEFLQNGDYDRKAVLYNNFSDEDKKLLKSYLSDSQKDKLKKAIDNPIDVPPPALSRKLQKQLRELKELSLEDKDSANAKKDELKEKYPEYIPYIKKIIKKLKES